MTHVRRFSVLLVILFTLAISVRSQTSDVRDQKSAVIVQTSDGRGRKAEGRPFGSFESQVSNFEIKPQRTQRQQETESKKQKAESGRQKAEPEVREVYFDGLLRYPSRPPNCFINGQVINMLVLGDSIMWGQGLREDEKISYRVQSWLCHETGRPVRLWREAHSGAVIDTAEPREDGGAKPKHPHCEPRENPAKEFGGEVNVCEPTIPAQLDHALESLKLISVKPEEVHFVLMDGCINDFNVDRILDPAISEDTVAKRAREVCYDRMKPFLEKALALLPNARFIVTGYYPVITEKSARNLFYRATLGWRMASLKQKWVFPSAKNELFEKAIEASNNFATSTNFYLKQSVTEAGAASGRISFVPVFDSGGAFGSPGSGFAAPIDTSLLWTSRSNATGRGGLSKFFYVLFTLNFHAFRPNDQVYPERKIVCKDADLGITCRIAAYGHPNTKGVKEYVRGVTAELQRLMAAGWMAEGRPSGSFEF